MLHLSKEDEPKEGGQVMSLSLTADLPNVWGLGAIWIMTFTTCISPPYISKDLISNRFPIDESDFSFIQLQQVF